MLLVVRMLVRIPSIILLNNLNERAMRAIVSILLIVSFLPYTSAAQASDSVQWASEARVSSAYDSRGPHSPDQLLGKPSFTAQLGSVSPCAWVAHEKAEFDTTTHGGPVDVLIQLRYDTPVHAQQVAVFEQANAGAITKVVVKGDTYVDTVLSREVSLHPEPWNILHVFFNRTPEPVHTVELILRPGALRGPNSIDACALSTDTIPVVDPVNEIHYASGPPTAVHLSGRINSAADELMPRISADGQTMYFCRIEDPDNIGQRKLSDIWVSKKEATGFWSQAEQLSPPLNNEYSNFVCSTSPDGNHVMLANTYNLNGTIGPGLSTSSFVDGTWSFPEKLVVRDYANAGTSVDYFKAADGNTLLMSIELPTAHGGNDIYVSFLQDDGTFSRPQSLGTDINTAGKEMTMFLASDGRTLFFSSDGHNGYGGQDIFMSRRLDDSWTRWSEPINLGPAVNDRGFNGHFTIPATGDVAYFTSSERGTRGKSDIFKIDLPDELKPQPVHLIVGKVVADNNQTLPESVRVEYETLSNGKRIGSISVDRTSGAFTIAVPGGEQYGIHVNATGFVSVHESVDFTSQDTRVSDTLVMHLKPLEAGTVVRLNNIFFNTAESELLPTSFSELNRVVELLQLNQNMVIAIVGHTDNRGSDVDNRALSLARAKSVYQYLLEQGIPAKQLKYDGVGSEQPVATNATPQGMAKNRRVEFTIEKR